MNLSNPERLPLSPPIIHPVESSINRPVWSVMIPAYNCSGYLAEAIKSVLAQDEGVERMHIEVVDDASTDADIEALVEQLGMGRIKYYRQPVNAGSVRNFETALNRSIGHLVHLLHADDRVLPGYYRKIESLFDQYPQAAAAFCRNAYINQEGLAISKKQLVMESEGIVPHLLELLSTSNRLQPPAMTVRRDVYEKLGGFYGVNYGEDWEMWARIAANYSVVYTPECLAEYRIHGKNVTAEKLLTATCFADVEWVLHKISLMLPEEKRDYTLTQARRQFSAYVAAIASDNFHRNSGKYLRMAANNLSFHPSFKNFGILTYLFVRREGSRIKRLFRF